MADKFKSFFKTVGGNEGGKCNYPTRLDTYGCGCSHDCSYCYAKSLLDFRKLWNPLSPRTADISDIRKTVNKKLKKGDIVRLGGMTDCFQPIEKVCKTTLETIKILNEAEVGYLIVTKSDIVADDEYINTMNRDLAHIQISLTSTDDDFCLSYEKASPPSSRIKAIEKLYDEGFDIQLRLSPFIPQLIPNGHLDMDLMNSVRCDKVLVEFLRVNTWIRKWFDIDYSEYTEKQSGYLHLPLELKKKYLSMVTGFREVSVCDDVDGHYEFWKNNVNANPEDCCNLNIKI